MIGVMDYGIGNIGSILNMLQKIGAQARAVTDADALQACDQLILPGVGAYDAGMELLESSGLRAPLDRAVAQGKPLLGICLGMQMLGLSSEEGTRSGLGYIPFACKRFQPQSQLKVPHMGWDFVTLTDADDPLAVGFAEPQRYYFVHSYYAECADPADALMLCEYGVTFAACVRHGRVWGTQFHPEKSHRFGMRLLQNFAEVG